MTMRRFASGCVLVAAIFVSACDAPSEKTAEHRLLEALGCPPATAYELARCGPVRPPGRICDERSDARRCFDHLRARAGLTLR